ncbi:hypothetical protein AB0M35_14520 [Micromonospora sp. NPDC051196]|uniref:hypothetical protein n=1 Tax=Micromonospora sp. NPDC051196 TaxID=3155281 RepID=UPI00343B49C5
MDGLRRGLGWALLAVSIVSMMISRGLLRDVNDRSFIAGYRIEDSVSEWGNRLFFLALVAGAVGLVMFTERVESWFWDLSEMFRAWGATTRSAIAFLLRRQNATPSLAGSGPRPVVGSQPAPRSAAPSPDISDEPHEDEPVVETPHPTRRLPDRPAGTAAPAARRKPQPGVLLRYPLFCGVIGGVGATLGWFVWVAIAVFRQNPGPSVLSIVVGSVTGLTVEMILHYRRVARADATDSDCRATSLWQLLRSIAVFSVGGLVLQTVLTNTFAEIVKEVYRPFLASFATFLIAGAALGIVWVLAATHTELGPGTMFMLLMLTGTVVALPLWAYGLLARSGWDYDALAAWWTLTSLAVLFAFLASGTRFVWGVAVLAVTVIAVVMLWATMTPLEVTARYSTSNSARGLMQLAVDLSESILHAPDMPADSWNAAARGLSKNPSGFIATTQAGHPVTDWIARTADCSHIPATPTDRYPQRYLIRKTQACGQLALGTGSALARSFLVVLAFAISIGFAPRIEARTRPNTYRHHRLRFYDRALAIGLVVLLIAVPLAAR